MPGLPGMPNLPDPEALFQSWWPIIIAVVAGTLYAIRQYMHGAKCTCETKMLGKTVVITGASGGIGREVALDMAYRGARVVLACRTDEDGQKAAEEITTKTNNKNVVAMKCDMASLESVRTFVTNFKKKEWPLHILVNNAGVMMLSECQLTEDEFEKQFQVNYLGAFLLSHLLLDTLKSSAPSRIINTVAAAYQLAEVDLDDVNFTKREYSAGQAFAQSKLAIALFTRSLAKYLEGTEVAVSAVNPGICNTQIHRHMPFKKSKFLSFSFSPFVWMLMKTAEDGAQTTLYCALAEGEDGKTGKIYRECKEEPWDVAVEREDMNKKLWDQSLKWIGCDDFGKIE